MKKFSLYLLIILIIIIIYKMYPVIEAIKYVNYQNEISRHIEGADYKLLDIDMDNKSEIIAIGNSYSTIYKVIDGKVYNIGGVLGNDIRIYENTITKERHVIAIENVSYRLITSNYISYIYIIDNKLVSSKILINETSMDGDREVYYDSEYEEISKEDYLRQFNEVFMNLYEIQQWLEFTIQLYLPLCQKIRIHYIKRMTSDR